MSTPPDPARLPLTVFLSYASEDRKAAQAIRDALPAYGLEVWYDESALDGGDVWDQKIRRQIRECDFFMPLISAQTEARPEGYFRREWRLAVERTLDMADDHTFLLPVVIDGTAEAGARVPDKFLTVQWIRLPGGQPTPALEALCRRLVSGQALGPPPRKKAPDAPARLPAPAPSSVYPELPREEPGQRLRFWVQVLGWSCQSAWTFFSRFPRWIRILAGVWLFIALLSRGCTPSERHHEKVAAAPAKSVAETAVGDSQDNLSTADVSKLGAQIAREFSEQAGVKLAAHSALLVIPFGAPSGDPAAQKLAESTFVQTYGKVAISHHGHVDLVNEPLSSLDSSAAAARGRAHHSNYVLFGAVDSQAGPPSLIVKIVAVADGAVLWSHAYPSAGADPAKIATDVDSKVQSLEEDN
jgi:TolB-like protein